MVVRVRVKFLAGLDGQGETTEIFTRNIPDLGFKEAAGEAVKKMKFAPIYHQGRNIKVYVQKTIVFQPYIFVALLPYLRTARHSFHSIFRAIN